MEPTSALTPAEEVKFWRDLLVDPKKKTVKELNNIKQAFKVPTRPWPTRKDAIIEALRAYANLRLEVLESGLPADQVELVLSATQGATKPYDPRDELDYASFDIKIESNILAVDDSDLKNTTTDQDADKLIYKLKEFVEYRDSSKPEKAYIVALSNRSMAQREAPYPIVLWLGQSRKVTRARCGCLGGRVGSCKHVKTVIRAIFHHGEDPTPTTKRCSWQGSKKKGDPDQGQLVVGGLVDPKPWANEKKYTTFDHEALIAKYLANTNSPFMQLEGNK